MGRQLLYISFQVLLMAVVGAVALLFLVVLASYLSQFIGWFGVLMLYITVAGIVLLLCKRGKSQ